MRRGFCFDYFAKPTGNWWFPKVFLVFVDFDDTSALNWALCKKMDVSAQITMICWIAIDDFLETYLVTLRGVVVERRRVCSVVIALLYGRRSSPSVDTSAINVAGECVIVMMAMAKAVSWQPFLVPPVFAYILFPAPRIGARPRRPSVVHWTTTSFTGSSADIWLRSCIFSCAFVFPNWSTTGRRQLRRKKVRQKNKSERKSLFELEKADSQFGAFL